MSSADRVRSVARVIARLLTDPSFAAASEAAPDRLLAGSDFPPVVVNGLAGRAEAWASKAARFTVTPGPDLTPWQAPPLTGPSLGPRLASGRPLARGRKPCVHLGHRTVSFRQTLRRVERLESLIGITRLADTTGVDRVGIPVWTTIRPENRDTISVYNGKGTTPLQARVGAYMEAIERHAAERRPADVRVASTIRLRRDAAVVTPADLRLVAAELFDPHEPVEWTRTWDLLHEEHVWAPVAATMLPYDPAPGVVSYGSSSNGLASGNTIEEAICHGLAEGIERDAATVYIARGYVAPIARVLARGVLGDPPSRRSIVGRFPEHVDLSTVPRRVRRLVDRFRRAGLHLGVIDMTSDLGIPAFQATAVDERIDDVGCCFGFGTHPTAEVALARAVTEAAQSRVTAIQGAREDLPRAARFLKPQFPFAEQGTRRWRDVPTAPTPCVRDDIRIMLAALRRAGVSRCLLKDVTHPRVRVPVVMVIVPELENWAVSAAHDLPKPLGARALATV